MYTAHGTLECWQLNKCNFCSSTSSTNESKLASNEPKKEAFETFETFEVSEPSNTFNIFKQSEPFTGYKSNTQSADIEKYEEEKRAWVRAVSRLLYIKRWRVAAKIQNNYYYLKKKEFACLCTIVHQHLLYIRCCSSGEMVIATCLWRVGCGFESRLE